MISLRKKIDNFCSSIFSFSFLTIFIFLSFIFFIIQIVFVKILLLQIPENLYDNKILELLIDIPYTTFIVSGFLFIIDILFLGVIKKIKIKWIANIYYHIQKVYRVSTLFYLYEHLYYHVASNVNRKVIILILKMI